MNDTRSDENGTVSRRGSDLVLRFERLLPHPITKVWTALTDPAECARWLGDLGTELAQGGPFELSNGGQPTASGTVTELVPPGGDGPAVVEYTWHATFADVGSAVIRWELAPGPSPADQTRLVLTQTAEGSAFLAEGAAGWHGFLDQLDQLLSGRRVTADQATWRGRRTSYSEAFGVPPNPAVP